MYVNDVSVARRCLMFHWTPCRLPTVNYEITTDHQREQVHERRFFYVLQKLSLNCLFLWSSHLCICVSSIQSNNNRYRCIFYQFNSFEYCSRNIIHVSKTGIDFLIKLMSLHSQQNDACIVCEIDIDRWRFHMLLVEIFIHSFTVNWK